MVSKRIRVSIMSVMKKTFYATNLKVIYEMHKMPLSLVKDESFVPDTFRCIYQFPCICRGKYIGRTKRCSLTRVKEHIPKWLIDSVERKHAKAYHKTCVR